MLSDRDPAVSIITTKALNNTVATLGRNRAFCSVKYQDGLLIRDLLVPPRHALSYEDPRKVEQIC